MQIRDGENQVGWHRVLVVDDSALYAALIERLLTAVGYHVSTVQSGNEAFQAVSADPGGYQAIVLDLCMPGLDGVETWHKLNGLRPGIPTVFCSSDLDSYRELLPQAGHVRAVVKPYTGLEMAAIAKALEEALAYRQK